jgi:hypothetical protein
MRMTIFAMLLSGCLASLACFAAENPQVVPTPAKLAQQVNEAREYWKLKIRNSVQFVAGNDLWQPGKQYKSGSDWLALVCDGKHCTLVPAALDAKEESWQGHYDDQPTAGQHLLFRQATDALGKPVAWFLTTGAPPWLKPGPVSSYYAGGRYNQLPDKKGTMEFLIEMPDGRKATLVPMLVPKSLLEKLAKKEEGRIYYGTLLLQLRTLEKRQLLPGAFGMCSGEVTPDYLLWAGDLDGDGKPDFLVSYIDADGPVHLFLSSAATREQLVGLAGVFNSPPFGGECDGGPPSYLN